MLTRYPELYLKGMREFCGKFMGPPSSRLFTCGAGSRSGTVDAYGRFQLCMLLRHPDTVYDLRKGSLEDALDRFFPSLRERQAENPEYLEKCARCFIKGFCEQCPGKSWSEYGELDKPVDYLCRVAHAQARYLGLLAEDEYAWQVEDGEERIRRFAGTQQSNKNDFSNNERNGECLKK